MRGPRRRAARLCRLAAADPEAIPAWIEGQETQGNGEEGAPSGVYASYRRNHARVTTGGGRVSAGRPGWLPQKTVRFLR